MCYHVIGDSLRGAHGVSAGAFASARFRAALAAEPTVLAPPRSAQRTAQPATFAWAVAATLAAVTVVGWTAFSMVDVPPTAIAKAREAASVRAAQVKPPADVASRLSARPPGILAGHGDPGRRPVSSRGDDHRRRAAGPEPYPRLIR